MNREPPGPSPQLPVRVLVIDDSAVARKIFLQELSRYKDIEVVGTAPDPYIGRDKIVRLKPDVVILDVEMPRMDGLSFLKRLMRYHPVPTIIVSSLTSKNSAVALEAVESGAVDVLAKPGGAYSLGEMSIQLAEKVRAAAHARKELLGRAPVPEDLGVAQEQRQAGAPVLAKPLGPSTRRIVALGASTGGTEALKSVLTRMPPGSPGIIAVQHMPARFTSAFAERLDALCPLEVREARHGDAVRPGRVLIAPGNQHILLKRGEAGYFVEIRSGPLVCHQRPSVDVLFRSVARHAGRNAIGVIMTGMGKDGAHGLLELRRSGARTVAQDESSCVIFGMPKEAVRCGAAEQTVSLERIPHVIVELLDLDIGTSCS